LHNLFIKVDGEHFNVLLHQPTGQRLTKSAKANDEHTTTIRIIDFGSTVSWICGVLDSHEFNSSVL
jgi:hypothetical protein